MSKNVACANCSAEISKQAKACPQCGHPVKRKTPWLAYVAWAFVIWAFVIFIVMKAMTGGEGSVASNALSNRAPSTAAQTMFSKRELDVLRFIIANDIQRAKNGDASVMLPTGLLDATYTTVEQMQGDYERNEVAGDNLYRGKRLLLIGKLASIDRSIGENYFLHLHGGSNPFMPPRAMMADGYKEWLSTLEKGERVGLSCIGDGMLIGSVSLKECEPLGHWANAETGRIVEGLPACVGKKNDACQKIALVGAVAAVLLPQSVDCTAQDTAPCLAQIEKIINDKVTVEKALEGNLVELALRFGMQTKQSTIAK